MIAGGHSCSSAPHFSSGRWPSPLHHLPPEDLFALRAAVKVAVTDLAAFMVILQERVPRHAPDQPAKREPGAGVALSLTTVRSVKLLEQLSSQVAALPAGEKDTLPDPAPALM
jgi:hypothetical protein